MDGDRSEGPQVVVCGMLDLQVCVPAEWSDKQAIDFADGQVACGTDKGWQIRRAGDALLAGAAERVPCDRVPGFVHIMLNA